MAKYLLVFVIPSQSYWERSFRGTINEKGTAESTGFFGLKSSAKFKRDPVSSFLTVEMTSHDGAHYTGNDGVIKSDNLGNPYYAPSTPYDENSTKSGTYRFSFPNYSVDFIEAQGWQGFGNAIALPYPDKQSIIPVQLSGDLLPPTNNQWALFYIREEDKNVVFSEFASDSSGDSDGGQYVDFWGHNIGSWQQSYHQFSGYQPIFWPVNEPCFCDCCDVAKLLLDKLKSL